jgi:cellulose synthase/poly-beta-1,6-N-acetylglucosamine synthase-like glycosyltransferase/spore germination protein YaaH/peptidoglycan/xylan/chitin deacetylase (PgdA/CDA1 family)
MSKPVFYDPQRRRWRFFRRLFDVLGVVTTLLIIFFVVMVFRTASLPKLLLPEQRHTYKALKEKEQKKRIKPRPAVRKLSTPATEIKLNSGEGIRGAFYVKWDAASFASLHEYVHQIDLLFPEWLHVLTPDGRLQAVTESNTLYDVIDGQNVETVDEKVMPMLRDEHADTEVLPLVNNYDPIANHWVTGIGDMLNDSAARANFRAELMRFLATDKYRGLTLDFEDIPENALDGYRAVIAEMAQDLHARNLKLYVSVPAHNPDFDYGYIAANSDGVILMNYDEHYPGGPAGPVASQEWFTKNLESVLKVVPPEKLICAIANYGYDWWYDQSAKGKKRQVPLGVRNRSVQEAWLAASDSDSDISFDSDVLNPHFAYLDEPNTRHEVWFTDAVTALNQMRAAQRLGINTFALWRLGAEDRSLWNIWDTPQDPNAPSKLSTVPPGIDVDLEGKGEILQITAKPVTGHRAITVDPSSGIVTNENFDTIPTPYELSEFGSAGKQVAITFDDGPDPTWTPRILDVLKQKGVHAAFFLIGVQADKYSSLTARIYREGHEIGNHTFTHPDVSSVSDRFMKAELNFTERFFAARLGVKTILFRPPYSIDQEPDTADQVRPLELSQQMGYVTIGDKIDPYDWKPGKSAEQITHDVMAHLPPCADSDQQCGNIVLLHDGGGDRRQTIRALGMIIDGLRARGYQIVSVSDLLGKTKAEIMPPLGPNERWQARFTELGFWAYGAIYFFIVLVFFIGDTLMSARLLLVGSAAIFDRVRKRRSDGSAASSYRPSVAVLVPAYNEEKVIERTVHSVLASDYPDLRVIVIDDGSTDQTLEVSRRAFETEIQAGRVLVLTKPNSGKADALNLGLKYVNEELFIGIDADTMIAPDAISYLVPHFANPQVAAVAGNAKVGNRINLWTRWQALEYVTSQNFERRALNTMGAVTVVPGAIGAWRTAYVMAEDSYHVDTVAEDADLTMRLLRRGYRVEYEDRAIALTEAPHNANGLMRQRFRWSFGILQASWKHRHVIGRKGVLGWVALPNIFIFQILLPLFSPLIDLMFVAGLLNYAMDKHYHPDTANPASLYKLIAFFLAFMVIDFIASTIAFLLERNRHEKIWLLGHVWLQRIVYRELFSIVLIKTIKRAVDGKPFSWDKLERRATVRMEQAKSAARS